MGYLRLGIGGGPGVLEPECVVGLGCAKFPQPICLSEAQSLLFP